MKQYSPWSKLQGFRPLNQSLLGYFGTIIQTEITISFIQSNILQQKVGLSFDSWVHQLEGWLIKLMINWENS